MMALPLPSFLLSAWYSSGHSARFLEANEHCCLEAKQCIIVVLLLPLLLAQRLPQSRHPATIGWAHEWICPHPF